MNSLADLHTHTSFSTDSEAAPELMLQKAISLGLSAICFTDHNDYDYPKEDGKTVFSLDFDSYISSIRALQAKYRNKLPVYLGVEQGLQASCAKRINAYDPNHELDFIIGSSHLVHGKDPYYPDFWQDSHDKDPIISYFESIYENIQCCDNYDVYGHLDYIIRYAPDQDLHYDWKLYEDLIDQILRLLIEKGKGIEINTAGLKYGLKETNPCYGILKRYRKLGGEILTIGSDGHKPEHLAYAFDRIPDIMKDCGFNYYTIFKKRKPEFIRL